MHSLKVHSLPLADAWAGGRDIWNLVKSSVNYEGHQSLDPLRQAIYTGPIVQGNSTAVTHNHPFIQWDLHLRLFFRHSQQQKVGRDQEEGPFSGGILPVEGLPQERSLVLTLLSFWCNTKTFLYSQVFKHCCYYQLLLTVAMLLLIFLSLNWSPRSSKLSVNRTALKTETSVFLL